MSVMFRNLWQEEWLLRERVEFDGIQRLIYIHPNISEVTVKAHLYSAWKRWIALRNNAAFAPAMRVVGGDPIGGGQFAGDIYFMTNGWRVVIDHFVIVTGALYDDESVFARAEIKGGNEYGPFIITERGGVYSTVSALVQSVETVVPVVTGDVTAIPAALASIGEKTDNVVAAVSAQSTAVADINSRTTEMATDVNSIDARTADMSTVINIIDARTADTATDINSIDARTTEIATDINNIDTRSTEMATDINTIEARTGLMATEVSSIEAKTTAIESEVTTIEARTAAMATEVSSIESRTTDIATEVSSIEVRTADMATEVNTIEARTAEMATDVNNIDTWTGELDVWTEGMDTWTAAQTAKTEEISADINTLETWTGEMDTWTLEQSARTTEMEASLDGIDQDITAMQSSIDATNQTLADMSQTGGLTPAQETMLLEMYDLLGLDPAKPLVVSTTQRTAGGINQTISTHPTTKTTTVTRV